MGERWSDTQVHTEMLRWTPLLICADAKRDILREFPLTHTHTLSDLLSPVPREEGTTQVPGGRPSTTCSSGLEPPTCPIWDVPALSLPLPVAAYLPPRNRVADGTWGLKWQEQGSVVS